MRFRAILGGALVWVVAGAAVTSAQTLGDLARKEQERRKTVKATGKVYTNDSLRREPAPAVPATAPQPAAATPPGQPSPGAAAPAAAGTPPAGTPPAQAAPPEPPRDQAYWQKRIADARAALSRAQIFAEALQSRINALSTDFVNRDDPAQRDVIGADRQKSLAELDRVKQEIQQHQKAITGIQEEARRAGVPAGWVR